MSKCDNDYFIAWNLYCFRLLDEVKVMIFCSDSSNWPSFKIKINVIFFIICLQLVMLAFMTWRYYYEKPQWITSTNGYY